jgi:hypothetical protein
MPAASLDPDHKTSAKADGRKFPTAAKAVSGMDFRESDDP